MRTRYAALAATFVLAAAVAATIILTSNAAPQPTSVAQQTAPHSPRDAPATPVTPPPPDRCTTPTDPTCILAVYKGAPDDYAQVQDIPDSVLIQPDDDGRYQVDRGQQITVVTAAPLPADYTRFYLQRRPQQVTVSPTSAEQLIPPVGTTYTFTVTTDDGGANLISFDLTAARPLSISRPGIKPELGDVVVTTNFLVPTLRYDTLDITGAATTPGSYAFLETGGDATSALDNFSAFISDSVELRIHPLDASGASRAAFYDAVQVGDSFDYRTNGVLCAFRFRVTSVTTTASPRSFGVEYIRDYGGWCGSLVDDPGAPKDVQFVWSVRPGYPVSDAARVLLRNEPTGPGTYRLIEGLPYVIDVPAGMQVIFDAFLHLAQTSDAPLDAPRTSIVLLDAQTGSQLDIDPERGREIRRITTSPAVDALFDQIIASLRVK